MNSALVLHLICLFETVNLLIYKESYNIGNREETRGSFLVYHSSVGEKFYRKAVRDRFISGVQRRNVRKI